MNQPKLVTSFNKPVVEVNGEFSGNKEFVSIQQKGVVWCGVVWYGMVW